MVTSTKAVATALPITTARPVRFAVQGILKTATRQYGSVCREFVERDTYVYIIPVRAPLLRGGASSTTQGPVAGRVISIGYIPVRYLTDLKKYSRLLRPAQIGW